MLSLPARLGLGWWADYADKRKILAACYTCQAVGILILAGISSPLLLLPFLLVFAPGFGGPIPVRPALQADHFGLDAMGSIQGLLQFIGTIGALIGPIFVGGLVDLTGTYRAPYLVLSVCAALAAPLILALPRARATSGP